ncbi:Vacuolar (H+)-ATPase G subunit [Artemisia annua]|uniref:V-type proton ATPase subunit G n=1 Tax=Artemisia annua TaxID=35608 RepID=A0A2U1PSW7_ARTAN|nr:Vacuolar (H+)-ATPase G subunit [Artemisia annua]
MWLPKLSAALWFPCICEPCGVSASMDSSRGGQNGIQLLLAAEQEAQQIVNAARNAKLARLKQAKEEAEREVAEFRAQMEAEYQRKLTESSGDSGANVKRLEKETDEKIQHLKTEADRISSDVVAMLLKHITTVTTTIRSKYVKGRVGMHNQRSPSSMGAYVTDLHPFYRCLRELLSPAQLLTSIFSLETYPHHP